MTALRDSEGETYRSSLDEDPWSTAAELLERRDELLLAGWRPEDGNTNDLPPLVRDLGRAEREFEAPGEPDRLRSVAGRLEATETSLPSYRLVLDEPPHRWAPLWRRVFDQLDVTEQAPPGPAAADGTGLHAIQECLSGVDAGPIHLDRSLQWVTAASTHAAAQALAAALSEAAGPANDVALYCPDLSTAARVEEAFQRLGRPELGAEREVAATPVLQVLPLVLELCWEPVDPQVLMDPRAQLIVATPSGSLSL